MPAGKIPIATIQQMELVTVAIAPRDLRGTHTCKVLMDAKILMNAPPEIRARTSVSTQKVVSNAGAQQG